jgi:hypothetical protein
MASAIYIPPQSHKLSTSNNKNLEQYSSRIQSSSKYL